MVTHIVKKFPAFYRTQRFDCSQGSTISPYPEPILRPSVAVCNKWVFYGEELLVPHPTPKLKDHPLSASICNLRMHHAMVTGTHIT